MSEDNCNASNDTIRVDLSSESTTIQSHSIERRISMADATTTDPMVYQDHGEIKFKIAQSEAQIRRDVANDTSTIRRDLSQDTANINANIKDASWNVTDHLVTSTDRITDQDTAYYISAQNQAYQTATALAALTAGTNAQFAATQAAIELQGAVGQAATALAAAENAAASQLASALLSQQILQDGEKTRTLMNQLKMEQLNRELIEQNAKLVECRSDHRHLERSYDQSQFASVLSQMQNFQSQLQETRQGLVNFGTMAAGAGTQSSTSNNVR
jgi:hypothetical protein